MTDPSMQDTDQMLVNEARALERAVQTRQRKVDALQKQLQKRLARKFAERPKRYSVEFVFDTNTFSNKTGYPISQRFPTQEQSFAVDGGTEFFCTEVMSSLRLVGQAELGSGPVVGGQTVNVTAPSDAYPGFGSGSASVYSRDFYLQYFWSIRDTQSDRGWQDVEQPAPFMSSGHLTPLYLPAPARVVGGTKLAIELRPTRFNSVGQATLELLTSVQTVIVHMSFHGVEVKK